MNKDRRPRPECGLGKSAVPCDHLGRKDAVFDKPFAFTGEVRCKLLEVATGPGWQRRIVQRPSGGTRRGPGRRGLRRRLTEVAECRARDSGEGEHGRVPPKDVRGRDWRHCHCLHLNVGTNLIAVDLQEHIADAQGRTVSMGDDDLDRFHVGHDCEDARPTSSHLRCAPAAERSGSAPSRAAARAAHQSGSPIGEDSIVHLYGPSPRIVTAEALGSGGSRRRRSRW